MQRIVLDVYDLHNHFSSTPTLKPSNYELDQVFCDETTLEEVYNNLVADLVSFARDGGIATLFACGQTGSGKTFTICRLQ
jgi:kinesin family protein 2/24